MTSLLFGGGLVLIVGFAIWMVMRNARREGAAEQRSTDIRDAADAESQIHEVQAENRDPETTEKRLDDGTF